MSITLIKAAVEHIFISKEVVLLGEDSLDILINASTPFTKKLELRRYGYIDMSSLCETLRNLFKKLHIHDYIIHKALNGFLHVSIGDSHICTVEPLDNKVWQAMVSSHRRLLTNKILNTDQPIISLVHAMVFMSTFQYDSWWKPTFECKLPHFPHIHSIPHTQQLDDICSCDESAVLSGQIVFLRLMNGQDDLHHVYADPLVPYVTVYVKGNSSSLMAYADLADYVADVTRFNPKTLKQMYGYTLKTGKFHLADVLLVDDYNDIPNPYQTVLMYSLDKIQLTYLAKFPPTPRYDLLIDISSKN